MAVMRSSILLRAAFVVGSLIGSLAGCSYSPPARTDTSSAKYQADLDGCESSVPDGVDRRNAKTGLGWAAGALTRWSRIDSGLNACTAEELRQGRAAGSLVVTRDGIRCSDPNKPPVS
jgi:hypothetical protein